MMLTSTKTVSICLAICLGLGVISDSALGAAINRRYPLKLRIAQCRQLCYHQSLEEAITPSLCRSWPDCFMCHDYCRVLALAEWSLAISMCSDSVFCTQGCRIACAYHRLNKELHTISNAVSKGD